ncbi:MAG: hypothetical protein A2X12_01710 [Bacteroidetes bacterium GWE2_29_8]|nr:MAG: hypothetical protein A2X12_01710 [Bacteroidetes bacterium GWE2_29_8]OFY15366.1 MAG: hypothetical protein A2X02_02930 [Bacteroidetes bacterium GWF2_29_10]
MNKIVERYNKLADTLDNLSCGKVIEYANIQDADVCLDLGCGRGGDTFEMARLTGNKGKAIGIDLSEKMIEKAKLFANENNINNADFILSDMQNLPLDNETFDICISNCVLNHIKDKEGIWHEIFRVLKKGGHFVISDIYAIDEIPDHIANDEMLIAECWAGAINKNDYIKYIEKAGFTNVEIIKESTPYLKKDFYIASFTIKGHK